MYYDIDIAEAKKEIIPLTFNWCLIKLCYEMWKKDVNKAWIGNKKVKLHEIVGVGVNYVNELCNGKRDNAYNIPIPEGQEEIRVYLTGEQQFRFEFPQFSEYIVLSNLYNNFINKKRKSKYGTQEIEEREKELSIFCKKGKKIDEYIKYLKEQCITALSEMPLSEAYGGMKNYKYIIKNYLCGIASSSKVLEKERVLLTSFHIHIRECSCEMIAGMSDKSLSVLYEDITILFDRVSAEKYYREVRRKEKSINRKEMEITVEKNLKESEADVGETMQEDKDTKKKETKIATEKNKKN